MGVVGKELDAGVCSTGFAVLRPLGINPHILARLLQSNFANSQILRNNAGIAYPAVNEDCLLEVLLPMGEDQVNALAASALEVDAARSTLQAAQNSLDSQVSDGDQCLAGQVTQGMVQTSLTVPNQVPSPTWQPGFW